MAELKDSGARREFTSGAVRDIQEGKGRCDLLPLETVGYFIADVCSVHESAASIFDSISEFLETGEVLNLFQAIDHFNEMIDEDNFSMLLELSKHYEDGAKKYGERNWEKGIPLHCYIDSGVRHLIKYLRGDTDEPHDRAFVWNMMCAAWTVKHRTSMCDTPSFLTCYPKDDIDVCNQNISAEESESRPRPAVRSCFTI